VAGSQRRLGFLLLLTASSAVLPQVADLDRVQVIRQVEWISYELGQAPAPDAEWTRFEMPMRWSVKEGAPLKAAHAADALQPAFDAGRALGHAGVGRRPTAAG